MKKIIPLVVIIFGLIFAIIGTYKAAAFSFGTGQYANIWGVGTENMPCTSNCNQYFGKGLPADFVANCDTDSGKCTGTSKDGSHNDWWVAKFVCAGGIGTDGGNHECGGHSNLPILSETWSASGGSMDLGPEAQQCGKTIQLDVYDVKCRKPDGSWDNAACADPHMHGYIDFETPACPASTVTPAPSVTVSPPAGPGCGIPCTGQPSTFCQSATDGCTVCDANSGQCQNPNNTSNGPSGTPVPSGPVSVVPTVTPGFTPDMCSCDGMDNTPIFSGQSVTFTAYGKVNTANGALAYIKDAAFTFAKGNELTTNVVSKSGPIPATQDSSKSDSSKVEYKIPWTITLPSNLDPNATYGVWAQLDCAQKTAYNTQALPQDRVVLGASTQAPAKLGWLDQILNFFAGLFGQRSQPQSQPTPIAKAIPTSTVTPTEPPLVIQSTDGSGNKQLQIGTTVPGEIVERKACLIKFKVKQ